jgi:uncharacterized membrane protein
MNFFGRPISDWAIHRIFEIGIILKGLHSLLEILGGLVLLVVSTETIVRFAEILTRSELIEDPHDPIAIFLLSSCPSSEFFGQRAMSSKGGSGSSG